MKIEELKDIIFKNAQNTKEEFTRLFHGRGAYYDAYEYLLLDSMNKILFLSLYKEEKEEKQIIALVEELYHSKKYECFIVQKRYLNKSPSTIVLGELKKEEFFYELGLKYQAHFLNNQNMGFFSDMKIGHEYVLNNSKNKTVLNLFSYTCVFSVCAIKGGAAKVVNIDMSKSALNIGRTNHRLNDLDLKKVKFLPHNILKSWNAIKKEGPYDLIIIDPPSFQKGSFAVSNDYEKIIKRLNIFAKEECIILSCLNAPELKSDFIKDLYLRLAPEFTFTERLNIMSTHPCKNEERALKSLIFVKKRRT